MDETGAGPADEADEDGGDGAGEDGADGSFPDDDPLGDLAAEDEFYYGHLDDEEPHTALPSKVEAWRKRSATGAILTGFALGLQQVFEPKRDEPAVIMETSGDPPRDLPVEADFEYGRPRQTVVNVRPWLLPGADRTPEPEGQPAPDTDDGGTTQAEQE